MINVKSLFPIFLLFTLLSCSPSVANNDITPTLLPTLEPRPDFVIDTAPSESQVLSTNLFVSGNSFPEGYWWSNDWKEIDNYQSQICLKSRTGLLAQDGDDFFEDSKVKERVTLLVDGTETKNVLVISQNLELINIVDGNGKILKRGIQPRVICGYAELQPSVHEVLFQFRQTSGDILEYRWQFELTRG